MAAASSVAVRRTRAVESFANAAEAIGPLSPGCGVFAITRGQWSMIDAILACLDQVGQARLTLWTWRIAEYEVEVFERLSLDARLTSATLVVDRSARGRYLPELMHWHRRFGPESIRVVYNHSKIATIEGGGLKLLLRGSMNLNFNPRFEQFDLTEGGADFDLVRQVEAELPILPVRCSNADAAAATQLNECWTDDQLSLFDGARTWQP